MEYNKSQSGKWVNADEVVNGSKAKIITECVKQESKVKDPEGNAKTENIAKVRFQGAAEAVNMRLNWTTIYGLIDAFGKDSKAWIGNVLTAITKEAMVGDTMRTIVYLVPEGFELVKNEEKKLEVRRIGETKIERPSVIGKSEEEREYPSEDINPDDIPW
jgi:hypothetical protein